MANDGYGSTIVYRSGGQILDAASGGIRDGTTYFGMLANESASPNLGTSPNIGVYEYNAFAIKIGADTILADLSATAPGTAPRIYINKRRLGFSRRFLSRCQSGGRNCWHVSLSARFQRI